MRLCDICYTYSQSFEKFSISSKMGKYATKSYYTLQVVLTLKPWFTVFVLAILVAKSLENDKNTVFAKT